MLGHGPAEATSQSPATTHDKINHPPRCVPSVGTTDQGKGKGRSVVRPMGTAAYGGKGQGKGKGSGEGRLGQGGRGRSKGGEKPMGTTAYGGKGSKGRAANGDRPVGAASCRRDHHTMASCQSHHVVYREQRVRVHEGTDGIPIEGGTQTRWGSGGGWGWRPACHAKGTEKAKLGRSRA